MIFACETHLKEVESGLFPSVVGKQTINIMNSTVSPVQTINSNMRCNCFPKSAT